MKMLSLFKSSSKLVLLMPIITFLQLLLPSWTFRCSTKQNLPSFRRQQQHHRYGRTFSPFSSRVGESSGGDNEHDNIDQEEVKQGIDGNDDGTIFNGTYNPFRLAVLKLGMTELKYTSPLNYEKRDGIYACAGCGLQLFTSKGKYDSGSGWPSFWKSAASNRIDLSKEWDGRVECTCKKCGGHLGHVFPDGPKVKELELEELEQVPETDPGQRGGLDDGKLKKNPNRRLPRFCMNGASLKFEAKA